MIKSRHRRIVGFFGRVMLRELWWDALVPRLGLRGLSRRTRPARLRRTAAAYRVLAIRMGGVLIKVGQFLSSRLDLLPRQIIDELSGLQDEVGAERGEDIRAVIEAELGVPLERRFDWFDPVPIASASIGQVHRARLGAEEVVVKVQRPRIQEIVETDLAALKIVGGWLARLPGIARHVDVPALVGELSRSLMEEVDYLHEGGNAERFAASFKGSREVRIPKVFWSHTTRRVLTLEDVGAIKITDYPGIEAAGIDRADVARRLMDIYLRQVFEQGFFHADPHPGNLFVLPLPGGGRGEAKGAAGGRLSAPRKWQLVFVDFGMTGTLTPDALAGMREVLIAAGTRDSARMVRAFQRLDLLLPGADRELIEQACCRLFDGMFGRTTRDMLGMSSKEVRGFLQEFRELLYQMPFQVPQNLILLGRCVNILSGISMGLDPDFNPWNGIAPYAKRLVREESGAKSAIERLGELARRAAAATGRVEAILGRLEQGRLEVRSPDTRQQTVRLERSLRLVACALVFSSLLASGTAFFLTGHAVPAIALGGAAAALLAWIIFSRR